MHYKVNSTDKIYFVKPELECEVFHTTKVKCSLIQLSYNLERSKLPEVYQNFKHFY